MITKHYLRQNCQEDRSTISMGDGKDDFCLNGTDETN